MRNILLIAFAIFFTSTTLFGQTNKKFIDTGSVKNQFNYLIHKSYTYKDYKNVKLNWLTKLEFNVTDSLSKSKKEILKSYSTINSQINTIDSLKASLLNSEKNIEILTKEKQSISFLGIQFRKTFFKTLLVLIIGMLIAFLIFFITKYKQSYSTISQAKVSLKEVEEEFDLHRKKALEREQIVMRKLQDELNKHKKE